MSIPEGLPTLSYGHHEVDDGKACVMEYVSVISGEDFTDQPKCTHPLIRDTAINVNDAYYEEDDRRARDLVPLIPRLAGANHKAEDFPNFERDCDEFMKKTLGLAWVPCNCGIEWCREGSMSAPADDAPTQYSVEWLIMLLDWYEKYTGRTSDDYTCNMDDVAKAARLVGVR